MPCDYHILQSLTKGKVLLVLLETFGLSLFIKRDKTQIVYSLSRLLRTFASLGYQIYKNEIAYKTLYPTNLHRSTLPCES